MTVLWNNPDQLRNSEWESNLSERREDSNSLNDPLIGQLFEGRFRILAEIGLGGMGKVYKAQHIHMKKTVAIKTLTPSTVFDENSFLRFEQEARTASSLSHPNIIKIFDFGKSAHGFAYLVMEFIDGKTLEEIISETDFMPLPRFLRIFSQVCDGMQHAHKKGIIHRDLKPSNLMLSDENEQIDHLRIVDFGLAKLCDADPSQQLTQTGLVLGSPLFMSPEQCKGEELDVRTDIYSLGCVMYAALTGQVPLKGNNSMATMYKHISDQAPAISQIAPHLNLPPLLEHTVMQTLQKDPSLRPQSMAELSAMLSDSIANAGLYAKVESSNGNHSQDPNTSETAENTKNCKAQDLLKRGLAVAEAQLLTGNSNNSDKKPPDINRPTVAPKSSDTPSLIAAILTISAAFFLFTGFLNNSASYKNIRVNRNKDFTRKEKTTQNQNNTEQINGTEQITEHKVTTDTFVPKAKTTTDVPTKVKAAEIRKHGTQTASTSPANIPGRSSSKPAKPEKLISSPPNSSAKTIASPEKSTLREPDKISAELEDERKDARKLSNQFAGEANAAFKAGAFRKAKALFEQELAQEEIVFGKSSPKLLPCLAHIIACKRELNDAREDQYLDYALRCFSANRDAAISAVEDSAPSVGAWKTLALESLDEAQTSRGPRRKSLAQWSSFFFKLLLSSWTGPKDKEYAKLQNAARLAANISTERGAFSSSPASRTMQPSFQAYGPKHFNQEQFRGPSRQQLELLRRRFRMQAQ